MRNISEWMEHVIARADRRAAHQVGGDRVSDALRGSTTQDCGVAVANGVSCFFNGWEHAEVVRGRGLGTLLDFKSSLMHSRLRRRTNGRGT
jgi:hypothetical protein